MYGFLYLHLFFIITIFFTLFHFFDQFINFFIGVANAQRKETVMTVEVVAEAEETPEEDPDLATEISPEEREDAITAAERAISPETAVRRDKTAETVAAVETIEEEEEEAEEILSEKRSDSQSVHPQAGTIPVAPVKWRKIQTPGLEELTTDPALVAKPAVPELARKDHHPTAMTLVPILALIAMTAIRRKETKAEEDQDQQTLRRRIQDPAPSPCRRAESQVIGRSLQDRQEGRLLPEYLEANQPDLRSLSQRRTVTDTSRRKTLKRLSLSSHLLK